MSRHRGSSPARRVDETRRDITRRERSRSRSPPRHSKSSEGREGVKRSGEEGGKQRSREKADERRHDKADGRPHDKADGRPHDKADGRPHDKADGRRHDRGDGRPHDKADGRRHDKADERPHDKADGSHHDKGDGRPHDKGDGRWPHDRGDGRHHGEGRGGDEEQRRRDGSGEQRQRGNRQKSHGETSDEPRSHDRGFNSRSNSPAKAIPGGGAANEDGGGSGGGSGGDGAKDVKVDQNFALSGKLTAETNTYKGVVIMYSEPPEAKMPKTRWRLYPFKESESLSTLYIHRQSAYLIGRDRRVVDVPIDHPSCSKQHAVLQYRLVQFEKKDGSVGRRVRPYIIDLNSTNGTYVNNQRIESARYVELKEKDVLKFGFSTREYVMLHENSKDDEEDDSGNEAAPTGAAPAE